MEAAIESAAHQTAQNLQALIKQAGPTQAPAAPPLGKENDTRSLAESSSNAQAMTPAMPLGRHGKRPATGQSGAGSQGAFIRPTACAARFASSAADKCETTR